jgi:hypothetical protein
MSTPTNITNQRIQLDDQRVCHYCDDDHAAEGMRRQVYDVYQNLGTVIVKGVRATTSIVRLRTDCPTLASCWLPTRVSGFIRQYEMSEAE